jgi:hypothetical protein
MFAKSVSESETDRRSVHLAKICFAVIAMIFLTFLTHQTAQLIQLAQFIQRVLL